MMTDCIFCKILAKQIPAQVVAENDHVLVIKDIAPKAPTHYLIIPKIHVKNLSEVSESQAPMLAALLLMANQLSEQLPNQSFRLIINNGSEVGQTVFHLHAHVLAGKKMTDF